MADQDYPNLYEEMEDSAQRTRAAAISFEHVLGGPEADTVPVNGYPAQPTIAGRVKARLDPLVATAEENFAELIDETQDRVDGVVGTVEAAAQALKRYAGDHPTPPSTRYDGTPLEVGDEYTNTTEHLRYSWSGTAWVVLNASVQQLTLKLTDPVDVLNGAGTLGSLKHLAAPPRTTAGRLNDALPNGFGLSAETRVHILAGIDSLTAGAGGSNYAAFLEEALRGTFGDSGPGYMATDETAASWGSSTASLVFNLPVDDPRRVRSFNFGGFTYELLDGSKQTSWGPARDWETMRLFYLKQPGGGKFKVDHSNLNSATYRYEIDTASSGYELAYVDITKKPGGTAGLLFLAGSAAAPGVYGKVCVYGALITRDAGAGRPVVLISRQARGGHTVAQFADTLDAATQVQWYALLNPTLYLMNGGTNDAGQKPPIDAATLKTKFATIFGRLPTTCKKVMIAPNMLSGDEDNVMPSYRPAIRDFAIENGYGYINIAELIGTRARANSLGVMLDATHPNEVGNRLIARRIGEYLGVPPPLVSAPRTPYIVTTEGGGPAIVQHSVNLTQKDFTNLAADTDHVIYDLGMIGGFSIGAAEINLDAVRQASNSALGQKTFVRLRGGASGVNNTANSAKISTMERYSFIETPTPLSLVVSLAAENGRVQIVVRATAAFSLVVSGKVVIPLNAFTGQAVYEN